MHRNNPPLWNIQHHHSSSNNSLPQAGGLKMSFNRRNMVHENFPPSDTSAFEMQHANKEQNTNSSHPTNLNRVHSIHRNKNLNSSNLLQSFEARMAGTEGKTVGQLKKLSHTVVEDHANRIVQKIEDDPDLMEDSPMAEELRKEVLRDMPQCLSLKRCVRIKLSKSVSQKSKRKPIGCWKEFKYRNSMLLSKFKVSFKNIVYSTELWYGSLKKIEGNFGSGVRSFFKFLRWIFILNLLIAIISFSFVVLPQLMHKTDTVENTEFNWKDLFSGEGYLVNTVLYYGYYLNDYVNSSLFIYSMPEAYFFTMGFIYLICFAVLSYSVAVSYRRSFIETEGGLSNIYANKIFCGWDFSIATKNAAKLKSKAIYNEMRELLHDDMRNKGKSGCMEAFWTVSIQIAMNILIIFLLIGTGCLMWFFMDKSAKEHWSPIYTALVVNIIMMIFPILFSWIVRYEDYSSPKKSLGLTLVRTFILEMVIIGVLIFFWLKEPEGTCWETSVGQEVYRLILFDFIFSIIVSPAFDLIVYGFLRYLHLGHIHFDIARHTMQIIYNQSLFWVGLMFIPLLPVIVVIKLFLIWYIQQARVLNICKPSTKSWRAAQTTTWFMMMAFLALLLAGGILGYIISYIPTTSCGPFRDYNFIYEIITIRILKLRENSDISRILHYVTKPGVIAIMFMAICCRVYYLRAKALAQRDVVVMYREMLRWHAKDKEFLLSKISRLTRGEWQYDLRKRFDPMLSSTHLITNSGDGEIVNDEFVYNRLATEPSTSCVGNPTSSNLDVDPNVYQRQKKIS